MADFCFSCTYELFGEEYAKKNDFAGLCKEDESMFVSCEGCGTIEVNSDGFRIDKLLCLK